MRARLDAIELRHLRYFVALAEELHFGRAAARCNVSQPPFSVAIQQLETQLGARLFVRSSRRVELSEDGRAFYAQARALLDQAQQAFRTAQARASGVRPVIRVGFHGSMMYRGLGALTARFRDLHPETDVSLHEMSSRRQLDAIAAGRLDAGFGHALILERASGVVCAPLYTEPFLVCLPASDRRWRGNPQQPIELVRLRDENLITFNRASSPFYYDTIVALCVDAGFTPRIEHAVDQWLTAVAAVSTGLGFAIVPACLAHTGMRGVIFRPTQPGAAAAVQCLHRPVPEVARLAEFVRLARQTIRPGPIPDA